MMTSDVGSKAGDKDKEASEASSYPWEHESDKGSVWGEPLECEDGDKEIQLELRGAA